MIVKSTDFSVYFHRVFAHPSFIFYNIWSRTPGTRGEGYNAKRDWLTDSLSVAE